MKEGVIFAVVSLLMACLISTLPFILCVWVEKCHTNYGVILALFIAPVIRTVNEWGGKKNDRKI